jgi:hypothetical protein
MSLENPNEAIAMAAAQRRADEDFHRVFHFQ